MNKFPVDTQNLRILIADDEQPILDEYIAVLAQDQKDSSKLDALERELFGEQSASSHRTHQNQFRIEAFTRGEAAVDKVREAVSSENPFSIAFLDVRMPPGQDGIETARQIREIDPNIQIVIVTGYADRTPEQIGAVLGPSDKFLYCQKPIHAAELRQFAAALSSKWVMEKRSGQQWTRTLPPS